jgi:multiple sugar transport system substrate-binding protein
MKKISRRQFLQISAIAGAAGALAACGSSSSASTAASSAAASSTAASSAAASTAGKTMNIYCWNTEFQDRVKAYYPKYNADTQMIGDVKVNWLITPSDNNAYQNALDEALTNPTEDTKVDLFLCEADYAQKYTKDGIAMDVTKLLSADDMKDQYKYTQDVVTSDGVMRGISWQACPGVVFYRRDLAKAVFGSDDPADVQAQMSDWDKFDTAAATLKKAGYTILPGYDDTYRAFSNNAAKPWVDGTKIQVDDQINAWVEQTENYTKSGYNKPYILWAAEWGQEAQKDSFCFFGPAWFLNFCLVGYTEATAEKDGGKAALGNGTWGEWGACAGPASYFWGGTWICAAEGTEFTAEISDIMKTLCCDSATMEKLAQETLDFPNNKTAVKDLSSSDKGNMDFLAGQNPYGSMDESAGKISMDKITIYDQGLNESFQTAYHDYFNGTVDKDTAYANFIKSAQEKYPELEG